jgi:hypothetical protein
MKNLIAISAVALTAATANAAIVSTDNSGTWTNGFQTTYNSGTFYVDTMANATVSGGNVVGGHGWGAYTLTAVTTTSVFTLSGTGAGTSVVATPNPTSNDNFINFNFANSAGLAANTGLVGIGVYFTVTNIGVDAPAPNVTAYFSGGGTGSITTGFVVSPGVNFIGFYGTNFEVIQNLQLSFGNAGGTGAVITITDLEYGLVPAPGSVALVGVAGLVGSRRRRA